MKMNKSFIVTALVALALTGCNDGGDSKGGTEYTCALPCIDTTPTLSTNTVSSATGGVVDVLVTLSGDLGNVSNITTLLASTELLGLPAGSAVVISPTTAEITLSVTVDAGTEVGAYYPTFTVTVVSPINTGSAYYIDPTKSGTRYTYKESPEPDAVLTSFTIPMITVTP